MDRHLGPESARNFHRRLREGFLSKYLSGDAILDIGYRGADPESQPITANAIGIDLDYPGYNGKTLPFSDASQDALFASHVLEHIDDWAGSLVDWYRVLKLNGYLVIAVPHRDLYERKADLPSRFNGDHKRFYTPASLLDEIEQALPVGGYRIRSLRDIDDGFDYTIPPQQHAVGCYEIELVVEKIAIPKYVRVLRPSRVATKLLMLCADLLCEALRARRRGGTQEIKDIQEVLVALPLPPFARLRAELQKSAGWLDKTGGVKEELRQVLAPILARQPLDENWYLATYPDVAKAASADPTVSAKWHFLEHGYFEGRMPGPSD
jgi:SAM-dependent methyltransferase